MIWHVHDRNGATLTIREQVEPDDQAGLLALFDACEDWFVDAVGLPSGPGDVQSLFYSLPEDAEPLLGRSIGPPSRSGKRAGLVGCR